MAAGSLNTTIQPRDEHKQISVGHGLNYAVSASLYAGQCWFIDPFWQWLLR